MSKYLDHLKAVADDDVEALREAEYVYGDSWIKRGGVGAFMMLARKWDRIEKQVQEGKGPDDQRKPQTIPQVNYTGPRVVPYDVLAHLEVDDRPEGLIDDVRDLRRYLMLVEAEMRARNERDS